MSGPSELSRRRRYRTMALFAGVGVALLGGTVLAGWLLHNEALKTIIPGSDFPIKPNIATGMLLCGTALSLLSRKTLTKPIRICTAAIAITVITLSALTVGEFLLGLDLGIEQWLIGDVPAALGIPHPGRMSPITALCFALVGVALFTASQLIQKRLRLPLVGGLGGILMAAGAVPLIGFFLEMLFGPGWNYMGMDASSVTAALAFLLLGSGLLALLRGNGHLTWSLDRLTSAGFAGGFVLMFLAGGLFHDFTLRVYQAGTQVSHAHQMLTEIEEIEAGMSDLENDQLGYIITGNERLLEEWNSEKFAVRKHVGRLQNLAADNSHQQPRIRQLRTLISERITWADHTIEARREGGVPAAQDLVASGTGIQLLAQSRELVKEIESEERHRLDAGQAHSEASSEQASLMLPLGIFLCLAILSLGLFFLNAGMGERKQAEHSLRQSEEGMRAILDSALDCIITMDHHGRVVEFNPAAEKTFGYRREEAIGQLLAELIIPPSLRERHHKGLARYLATGEAPALGQRLELSAVRRDGSEFPVELAIIRIGTQKPPMFTGFIRDITERKGAEEALRQAEEKYRSIFDHALEGIFQSTPDGVFLSANPALARMLGFASPEELIRERKGLKRQNYIDPRKREELKRLLDENGGVNNFEYEVKRKDGSTIWVSENAHTVCDAAGNALYYEGSVQDITKRARAELVLRESEEYLRLVIAASNDGIWEYDFLTDALTWSDRVYDMFGLDRRSFVPTLDSFTALLHPDDRAAFQKTVPEQMTSGARYEAHIRVLRGDGSYGHFLRRGRAVLDAAGKSTRMVGSFADLTSLLQAEQKLVEQANLLNLSQDAIMVRGMDDRIEFWNHGAEVLYGWTAQEVRERMSGDFLKYEEPVKILAERTLLETGVWSGECRHLTKEGATVIVRSRWTLVRDEHGQPKSKLVITTDITEQKKIEEQFLRAQRLESIGTLASGIAHDLNNVLVPIMMAAPVLRGKMDPADRERFLDIIESSAHRGADIIKQVLTFARGADGDRILLQPIYLIEEVSKIASQTFPKSITLRTSYEEDIRSIEADPTQLHQVLLNLCINARDAMPNGGELCLGVENFDVDELYASITPGATAGPHVMLQVTDSGSGIPKDVIAKIYDPFFTTKSIGRGTGLGLSTVAGIVKSYGGFIHVYSKPGHTTFKVFLPAKGTLDNSSALRADTMVPNGNGQTILLVDDEPAIREVAEIILQSHGYKVLVAEDGPSALALFAQHLGHVAVVVTDLAMPGMGGLMLVRTLRQIEPALKVIVSTGGADDSHAVEIASLQVDGCLTKPYTTRNLLLKLSHVLNDGLQDAA
jgi:PAS domain S-box-containing protein